MLPPAVALGNGNGEDALPDVVTENPTSGQTVTFEFSNKNRHVVVLDDVVLSATDTINMEVRRTSDSVWEQGATAYRWSNIVQSGSNLPINRANWPIELFPAGLNPVSGTIWITSGGLAVPTSMMGRAWNATGSQVMTGFMNDENLHDRVRLIIAGAATFSSGTAYMIRMQ